MSKLSTLTFAVLAFSACARSSGDLQIQPGPEGTIVAVGMPVAGKITTGSATFNFSHSDKLSIGVATGGPAPAIESADKSFKPASITKLVTTSIGLKKLGPDFVFRTKVAWTSEGSGSARDLVIVADGDPQVVQQRSGDGVAQQEVFSEILTQLKARGVNQLTGSLILISSDERRDIAIPAEGMEDSDSATCFGAISQAFNLAWNCAGITSRGWKDAAVGFPFTQGPTTKPVFNSQGAVSSFEIGSGTFNVPVPNVKPWYGRAFIAYLNAHGIGAQVQLEMPTGSAAARIKAQLQPPSAQGSSFTVESEPLSSLVAYTNKPSDNYFADSIFKTIAARHGGGIDLRDEGQAAIREAVAAWIPALANEVHLIDGAGLSHENHITARSYLALLTQFTKESWFGSLWNSLPIAGVDGTLKARMLSSRAQGEARAKTGTLESSGNYQLAGYVPRYGANHQVVEYVPFVILSQVKKDEKKQIFDLQTEIASKLFTLVNQ